MKTLIINIFIISVLATFSQAQPQQYILQLDEDITIHQLKSTQTISPLTSYRQLSESLNIWLIEIPATSTTQSTFKKETTLFNLQKHPQIKTAQINQAVELRNTPNDSWFPDQWQYNNKSEAFGMTNADIDALKAWNITTGGITVFGDEIVVAIIDGGVDLNHPDLINNQWTNAHEIPNNQIDDDKNYYIDDYYGWNFKDTSPDVGNAGYGHGHGTPIAGIIGAKGNNYEGVCGVNWNIKIMNLAVDLTEASIIEAYNYVLEMRKSYNETNGKEGAFVVATNLSLGIPEGKPADHPIWCAMYNALGEAGILNIGATANNLINVDERGDLPTTCSSDFLISVTNTNNRDELDYAAFGRQHIDLSAPGTGVFTVSNNGGYGVFGGTSAAAPHVAGAIALLYSTPNKGLMQIVQSDPSKATLLLKDFILQGTDPIPDLYHRSVSNGRLNLYNSLCELEYYFDSNSCLEEEEADLQIDNVQFNLNKDLIQIQLQLEGKTYLKVRLVDATGRLIANQYIHNIDSGNHTLTLPIEKSTQGIYYVIINTHSNTLSRSVLVL